MPTISQFYGLVVFMNYSEHPPAHFHVRYQGQEVSVEIQSGMVTGKMSRRALQMIFAWMELHQEELMDNWVRAQNREPLRPISPLM